MLTKRTDPAVADAYIKARANDTEAAKRVAAVNQRSRVDHYRSLIAMGYSPSEAHTIAEAR